MALENIVGYIVWRLGCTTPFVVSRVLALVEMEWFRRRGEWLTDLRYVVFDKVFYIEGLKEFLEGECYVLRSPGPGGEKGCIEYVCDPPEIDSELTGVIDSVVERVRELGKPEDINDLVVTHPLWSKLVNRR